MGTKAIELTTESRILVPTRNGEREIQLCLGDITRLKHEDKVDVVLISAGANDYSANRTSVIGALKYNLGIDVLKLSYRKQDLRKNFNCWISKSLPENVPYRQLMCFETQRGYQQDTLDTVPDLFRAMMPMFNNHSKTVITPLLATGNVMRAERSVMMRMIIKTAAQWMQIGLPLQTLKIVVYVKNLKSVGEREKECIDIFKQQKKLIEGKPVLFKEPDVKKELFLIHSEEDRQLAEILRQSFKNTGKKIFSKVITMSDVKVTEESWQHDFFVAMMSVSVIVPLLSESFLDTQSCLDQFNVALCCNRFTSRNIIAPICLERFNVPLYMGTVQWINCKERDHEKIKQAAQILQNQVSLSNTASKKKEYDIFLSYCHRNIDKAKSVLSSLMEKNPEFNIFFDYEELKTGVSWQKTLYSSLDSSRCVIALVSPDYVKSVVCMEEFNIALGKHLSKSQSAKFIPVSIEPRNKQISSLLADFPVIDATGNHFDTCIPCVCNAVYDWLENNMHHNQIFGPVMENIDIDVITMRKRKQLFEKSYTFDRKESTFSFNSPSGTSKPHLSTSQTSCDLFISSSLWDQRYVHFIVERLKLLQPDLRISDKLQTSEHQVTEARSVLVVMSSNYLKSPKEVDELNFILSKERTLKSDKHLYIVKVNDLEAAPTYVKHLFSDTCLTDDLWEDFLHERASVDNNGVSTVFNKEVLDLMKDVGKEFQKDLKAYEAVALLKAISDLNSILSGISYQSMVRKELGLFVNLQSMNEEVEDNTGETPNDIEDEPARDDPDNHTESDVLNDKDLTEPSLDEKANAPNEKDLKEPSLDRQIAEAIEMVNKRNRALAPVEDFHHARSCSLL